MVHVKTTEQELTPTLEALLDAIEEGEQDTRKLARACNVPLPEVRRLITVLILRGDVVSIDGELQVVYEDE